MVASAVLTLLISVIEKKNSLDLGFLRVPYEKAVGRERGNQHLALLQSSEQFIKLKKLIEQKKKKNSHRRKSEPMSLFKDSKTRKLDKPAMRKVPLPKKDTMPGNRLGLERAS